MGILSMRYAKSTYYISSTFTNSSKYNHPTPSYPQNPAMLPPTVSSPLCHFLPYGLPPPPIAFVPHDSFIPSFAPPLNTYPHMPYWAGVPPAVMPPPFFPYLHCPPLLPAPMHTMGSPYDPPPNFEWDESYLQSSFPRGN